MEEKRYIKRLAAAVLEQALKDYKVGRKQDYFDAKNWFKEKSRKTFGFYWCLEYSEANPNLVRKYLDECDKVERVFNRERKRSKGRPVKKSNKKAKKVKKVKKAKKTKKLVVDTIKKAKLRIEKYAEEEKEIST